MLDLDFFFLLEAMVADLVGSLLRLGVVALERDLGVVVFLLLRALATGDGFVGDGFVEEEESARGDGFVGEEEEELFVVFIFFGDDTLREDDAKEFVTESLSSILSIVSSGTYSKIGGAGSLKVS